LIGTIVIAVAALVSRVGTAEAVLSRSEQDELGIVVSPVTRDVSISEQRALELAAQDWAPPDPKVEFAAFLFSVTSSDRDRSGSPMKDRPVWIVRYTGLDVHSPGGLAISRAYSYFDAMTGEYLGTTLRQ
jgi:hypothetical protein